MVYDSCHIQYAEGNLTDNWHACQPDTAVVQIADVPGRLPPGSGEIAFPFLLRTIHDSGWPGLVELENYLPTPNLAAEQACLAALRAIDAAI